MKRFGLICCLLVCVSCTKKKEIEVAKGKCEDSHLIYKTCTPQTKIYKSAFEKAKSDNQLLLVKFGFEDCPWCLNLHNLFTREGEIKSFVEDSFQVVEINIKEESGKKVFEQIKGDYSKSAKATGYPFLILVNPATSKSVHLRTGPLEDNSNNQKGHSLKKIKMALNEKKKLIL